MTLREFRSMLLGSELHIYTDHKNLTYANLTSQRVLRWRLYLEEFAPNFHYIKGADNVLADYLSRAPMVAGTDDETEGINVNKGPDDVFDLYHSLGVADSAILECFLNEPVVDVPPISYALLETEQRRQPGLIQLAETYPDRYTLQPFARSTLVCYRKPTEHNWKILLPDTLVSRLVRWYHLTLAHAGISNLQTTLTNIYSHPQLLKQVDEVVRYCVVCQQAKRAGIGYGKLAPREANVQPWYEIAIDTVGPWKVMVDGQEVNFYATTIIDTATNLTELVRIKAPTAKRTAYAVETGWLLRYPRPVRIIHDQGNEFQGEDFQHAIIRRYGIEDVPTSVRNPQANAICERMHHTVGNILRTLLHANPFHDFQSAEQVVDYALATASHALRSTIHRTMGVSPGAIVFHRDMLMDIPYVADLLMLRDKRQAKIDYNLRRENNKRRTYDYEVGGFVLEMVPNAKKLGKQTTGPYEILRVHTNGTLTIRRSPGVTDRVNIRRLRPFYRRQ
jgi:transposase InsO family protein